MGTPSHEDAPVRERQHAELKQASIARLAQKLSGGNVAVSLLLIFGITGVAYAAVRLTSYASPKSGTEKTVNLHLSSPYGSLAVSAGVAAQLVARLDLESDPSTTPTPMFMRYSQKSSVGNLRISIGEDEGMLRVKPPLALWRANSTGSGLYTANYISGDNGSCYSYGQTNDRPILDMAEPLVPQDAPEYKAHLYLTKDLPMALNAELGFGESAMDLSGLMLSQADIETGASKVRIFLGSPNSQPMSNFHVSAGLGECMMSGICYSNASNFKFDGGIGYYALDFGGALSRNMDATVSVGLGKVTITIPPTAGRVQIFYDDNLFSSFNFEGLSKRRSGYATSAGFDRSNAPTLTLHLSSGMGKMTVAYR